jgi:hypothetical protein
LVYIALLNQLKRTKMKNYKSISEWMESNPSEDEQKKVMALINKGAVNQTRKEIYEEEKYLRKLQAGENIMRKLGFEPTKDVVIRIKEVKAKIVELSKGLPAPVKRAKKEVVEN